MEKQRKKIGLALGSGGAKGLAHIGVIKVLEENNIPIDYIAGTSAGALIGGLYAALKDINKIENLARTINHQNVVSIFMDPSLHWGLVRGNKAIQLLEKHIGNIKIEDLTIPFRAVASDIKTGEIVVIKSGKLSTAIRVSGSIPFVFEPFHYQGHYLIDGGASMPVPAEIARGMGADIVIAVNLNNAYFNSIKIKKRINLVSVLQNSINLLQYQLAKENEKNADVVIIPDVPDIFFTKVVKGEKLIAAGKKATEKIIPQLQSLL